MINKIIIIIMSVLYGAALITGISNSKNYTDFNSEENKLEHFEVGIIEGSLASAVTEDLESRLTEQSAYILKVKCIQNVELDFLCATEKVEVVDVYKGNNIEKGDRISVIRNSSRLFYNLQDFDSINLEFVNVMKPGKEYLVFLEKEIYDTGVYRTGDSIISPIFMYGEAENAIVHLEHDDGCQSVPYTLVKDNEFFVADEEALRIIEELKYNMIDSVIERNRC